MPVTRHFVGPEQEPIGVALDQIGCRLDRLGRRHDVLRHFAPRQIDVEILQVRTRQTALHDRQLVLHRPDDAPQAGVAVYERVPSGLLAAARIYDDVDIPEA